MIQEGIWRRDRRIGAHRENGGKFTLVKYLALKLNEGSTFI